MNTTQSFPQDDMGWEHNATRLWGIPLHPSGEIYLYDFITAAPNDRHDTQAKLFSAYFKFFINIFIMLIFISNLVVSICMILNRAYSFSGWCCLIPAFFGISWSAFVVLYFFEILNCREIVWYTIAAFTVSSVANSMLVLQKTYIVFLKQRWILVVGIICILPQLGFIPFSITVVYVTLERYGGCFTNYPSSVPLYWFGVTIPVNALFSGVFSYVAYQHYKTFGSEAWRRLTRNGIQIMCLVVFCNIICAICILFKVGDSYSQMFFVIDWCITSIVLVYHCGLKESSKTSSTAS